MFIQKKIDENVNIQLYELYGLKLFDKKEKIT